MTDEDKKMFASIMYPLGKIYDLALEDKHIMRVWFEALSDLSIEEVGKAVSAYLKSPDFGTYKPKPADIIKMIQGTSLDRSFQAWSKVEQAARRVGSYQTVVFDDPVVHRVIEDMGGWVELCQKNEIELPFVAKEFMARYKGFSVRGEIPTHSTRLYGLTDRTNASSGYTREVEPVLIGDHGKAKLLLGGGFKEEDNFLLLRN